MIEVTVESQTMDIGVKTRETISYAPGLTNDIMMYMDLNVTACSDFKLHRYQ